MEEFLAFFSFHSCSRAGIFNLTLVSFSPSQDSESHQTTSRQWLCRSPCGVTLQGSTCSCEQTTLASTPSSLQTGREAGSCEQAPPLPAGLLRTAESGQPGSCAGRWQYLASLPCTAAGGQPGSCEQFPLCQQGCPTQQRSGQSGSSEQFPLCQQVTPAGRLAGGRASTSRLLPHDPFRQASSTRLPFQDFSRAARLRYY